MRVVALTDSNLAFIKSSLRVAHKDVKSSHLTEAIAAGFGYETHAALLADPERALSPVKVGQGLGWRFNNRLAQLSRASFSPDLFTTALWSCELPDPVWRTFAKGDARGRDQWYWTCERRNIPYVHIETRRTLARLEWDCITIEPPSDCAIRDDKNLIGIMFRAFQGIASRKRAVFQGSAFYGEIEGLSLDEARRLAEGIALMLDHAIVRKKLAA